MEILIRLQNSQRAFEDVLRLETTYDEINKNKEGKRLLKWVQKRRRVVDCMCKMLKKVDKG